MRKITSIHTHTCIGSRRKSSPNSYRANQQIIPSDDGELERFTANLSLPSKTSRHTKLKQIEKCNRLESLLLITTIIKTPQKM